MDNEPYHDLGHHEAADVLASLYREFNHRVYRERKLPSGTIADLLVISPQGNIEIIEVKTVLKSSLIENARSKYAHWCNRLWVAVPHLTKEMCEEGNDLQSWRGANTMVGIIGVFRDAFVVYRQPYHQTMEAKIYNLIAGIPETP